MRCKRRWVIDKIVPVSEVHILFCTLAFTSSYQFLNVVVLLVIIC